MKAQFREKNLVLPIEEFLSLVLPRNVIMLQHLIHFPFYYLSSGRLWEVKKGKETFKLLALGAVAVAYMVAEKRWSLTRGGRNQTFDCIMIQIH